MPQAKVSQQEFIDLWQSTGGSAAEVAKIIRSTERSVHRRRRSIEELTGKVLLSRSVNSPDVFLESDHEFPDWQPLEVRNGLIVCFSDSHLIPHLKSTAHRALLKFVHELQPKAVVDMGDLLDFASISRHHRIGWDKTIRVKEELDWAVNCLDEIREHAPRRVQTMRCMGNHDQRFSGHLSNNNPAYEGVRGMSLLDHIDHWPTSWAIRVNELELEITHRWRSGIHAPYNNTMNAGISYATGHLHSQKIYPLTDLRGDRWGVDVGCMSSIYGPHFRYMEAKPRNHRSGFAVFRFVDYKLRMPELVRVIDEKAGLVEWRGQDFKV